MDFGKFFILAAFAVVVCDTAHAGSDSAEPNHSGRQAIIKDEFIYDCAPFPSVHSATIEETPSGFIAAFFGGEHEGHPEVCIYVCRNSGDGWSQPKKVADGVVNDTIRKACYNPVLFQVPGKELILFYKIGYNVRDWSGWLVRSFDDGVTWSTPEPLPEGILGPIKNRPVYMNGTLICGASTEDDGWRVHVEFSEDLGRTWSKTGPINGTGFDIIQPAFLVHEDGALQMVCRSRNESIITSYSHDYGRTWSAPERLDMPNNNSGIDATALHDGRFVMVYNHVKAAESAYIELMRTPINVAVSDDGVTWRRVVVLEDSPIGEYSYPSVMQGGDGMVHIVYTWRREKVRYVRIDPARINRHESFLICRVRKKKDRP